MGFMSASKPKTPDPIPITPRLSGMEMEAKDASLQTRKRAGLEDTILTLGRSEQKQRGSSLLGRAAS